RIDAGRDGRKRYRGYSMPRGKGKRGPVARGEELIALRLALAAPHRTDGVNHVARGQVVAPGDLGVAGVAAVESAALGEQVRARRAMDRAIDASAAKE